MEHPTCPECHAIIKEDSESCIECGCKIIWVKSKPNVILVHIRENLLDYIVFGGIGIFFLLVIFSWNKSVPISPYSNSSPSVSVEKENSSYSSNSDRYVVKEEIIIAAKSEASYDLMYNCIVNGDKTAVQTMLNNGQLKYLYRNEVVFLVKVKFSYCVVRQEGSTELLYVDSELLKQQ